MTEPFANVRECWRGAFFFWMLLFPTRYLDQGIDVDFRKISPQWIANIQIRYIDLCQNNSQLVNLQKKNNLKDWVNSPVHRYFLRLRFLPESHPDAVPAKKLNEENE